MSLGMPVAHRLREAAGERCGLASPPACPGPGAAARGPRGSATRSRNASPSPTMPAATLDAPVLLEGLRPRGARRRQPGAATTPPSGDGHSRSLHKAPVPEQSSRDPRRRAVSDASSRTAPSSGPPLRASRCRNVERGATDRMPSGILAQRLRGRQASGQCLRTRPLLAGGRPWRHAGACANHSCSPCSVRGSLPAGARAPRVSVRAAAVRTRVAPTRVAPTTADRRTADRAAHWRHARTNPSSQARRVARPGARGCGFFRPPHIAAGATTRDRSAVRVRYASKALGA
jgi:hypothetical protein